MKGTIDIDKSWTLFLDRDGVINKKKENGYIECWEEFFFIDGVLNAITNLNKVFGRTIIVTNQRGVGKKIMTERDLESIHKNMNEIIKNNLGLIDKIYCCTQISERAYCRKPNSGMAILAKNDFPEINFSKSIIVGDSKSDIEFGKKLGFKTVYISSKKQDCNFKSDFKFKSLYEFSKIFSS